MPQTISLIGAGSVAFARKLVNDMLFFDPLRDAEFRLMDIDERRLDYSLNTMKLVSQKRGAEARFTTTTDLDEALAGADFVVSMIQVGGFEATKVDFEVCRRHGLRLVIGDSMGVPGLSRALRTAPVLLDLCRRMERHCPNAHLLNYTNPMGMVMGALQRGSRVRSVGLCHGVYNTARKLASFIGVEDFSRVSHLCAGINHLAFFLRYEVDGEDAYPRIRRAFDTTHRDQELVRQEMFRRFGYFMTESSYHLSEYIPYFIKRDDLIETFDIPLDEYINRSSENYEIFEKVEAAFREGRNLLAEGGAITIKPRSRMRKGHAEAAEVVEAFSIPDEPSGEYASAICNAVITGTPYRFNGNLINTGLITNLPEGSCVEVPCLVDRNGVQPTHVGELPPQCAALIQTNINCQELTVRAILEQDVEHVYHAALMAPLASAVLSTREIVALVDDLLASHATLLPDWCRRSAHVGTWL